MMYPGETGPQSCLGLMNLIDGYLLTHRQKRYKHLSPADFEGEWSDAEDRCRIAIEGHGLGK